MNLSIFKRLRDIGQISPERVNFEVTSSLAHPSPPQIDMLERLPIQWDFIFYTSLTYNVLKPMSKKAISDHLVEKSH